MSNDAYYNQEPGMIATMKDLEIEHIQNEWHRIETAPKTGKAIEVNYGTPENPEDVCLAFWSERPVCMGGPTVYNKPGWATAGDDTDKNLPLDPPNYWREA